MFALYRLSRSFHCLTLVHCALKTQGSRTVTGLLGKITRVKNYTFSLKNMRLKLRHVPNLMLAFLPLIIAYNGHGIIVTILWMVLWVLIHLLAVYYKQMQKFL